MSTYLQLCSDLRRECGISGTGPTAVTGQTGELLRVVEWVAQSYTELQNAKQWRWLRSQFTVATVASDGSYAYGDCTDTIASALITRFKRWYPHEFKIYLTSAGVGTETCLGYCDWEIFKRCWLIGTQNDGYPSDVSIDPQNNIRLGAEPDAIYTLTGDYQKSAQVLAADGDTPEMPADFHNLIVTGAMKKYAAYSGAPDVWASARDEHSRMRRDLELDQLPTPSFGSSLA